MTNSVKIIPRELNTLIDSFKTEFSLLTSEQQGIYEDKVNSSFKLQKARDTLKTHLNGSTPFKVIFLKQIGFPVATLYQLDQIALQKPDFLKGYYEDDTGFCLRNNKTNFAKSLADLAGINDFDNPWVIRGLELVEDSNSKYGLSCKKALDFNYFKAPELKENINFSELNERGMPVFDKQGKRTSYASDVSVSGLFLLGDLDLVSNCEDIADSVPSGRVVLVSSEGTEAANKNLELYIKDYNNKENRK